MRVAFAGSRREHDLVRPGAAASRGVVRRDGLPRLPLAAGIRLVARRPLLARHGGERVPQARAGGRKFALRRVRLAEVEQRKAGGPPTQRPRGRLVRRQLPACATREHCGMMIGMAKTLDDFVRGALARIREITPEEAKRLLGAPDREGWHFVDVRESDEFAAGHVPGARSSPRGFLEVRADLVHPKRDPWLGDRDRKLVLYCGGGNRSALAAETLQDMGFTNVVSMAEGWAGWTKRGYEVEK